jgi:NADPH-dependent ferric siderophore reductase
MNVLPQFKLSGIARPKDAAGMLDEVCEHFLEHAEVHRTGNLVRMTSETGIADLHLTGGSLLIELSCPSADLLQISRNIIAEHLFYFAGDDPFELSWSDPAPLVLLPNIHEITVASVEDVTPHMRRVKFASPDITPFVNADMHVRLLVPPRGRKPVWPGIQEDGRAAWPTGEDELLVRVYTIRAVDTERGELWIDFLQHPVPGVSTPGADFARDAQPGDRAALLGPGGGGLPQAEKILLIGDESALPAIARIAAEVPAGTRMEAIVEVKDAAEEQQLVTAGTLDIRWLHRESYPPGATNTITETALAAIAGIDENTFVWVACEKEDVRRIRAALKARKHDRKQMYVAWYWERDPG